MFWINYIECKFTNCCLQKKDAYDKLFSFKRTVHKRINWSSITYKCKKQKKYKRLKHKREREKSNYYYLLF